jgi:hypothetical protein
VDGLSDADEQTLGTDPLNPDSDDDFWLDGAEVVAGTNPTNSTSFATFSFTINGGADVVTNMQLQVELATGLESDFTVVFEDIGFASSVTNQFATQFGYTLQNAGDGLHTVYLRLLKQTGALSPIFGRTVELDTVGPTISISSPTNGAVTGLRRINIEGFAADAGTNAPSLDARRAL